MLSVENVAVPDAVVTTGAPPERTPGPPWDVSAMVTPLTGLPPESAARTTTGAITAPAAVFNGCCEKARFAPAPPALVSTKLAVMPPADAVTVYAPTTPFATAVTLTSPLALVL